MVDPVGFAVPSEVTMSLDTCFLLWCWTNSLATIALVILSNLRIAVQNHSYWIAAPAGWTNPSHT